MVGHTETRIVDKDGGEGVYTNIQSALSALYDVGGVVYVEKGEYTITSPLNIDSNTSLIGKGNVVIKIDENSDISALKNKNQTEGNTRIYISGINIESRNTGTNNHLVDFEKVDDSVLEDITIDGKAMISGKAAIHICKGGNNRVSRCRIQNIGYGVFIRNPPGGPYLSTGNVVERCDIHHVYVGIYLLNQCKRNILRANYCHETQKEGGSEVGKDGILVESCSKILIEGNICYKNAEHGIYIAVYAPAQVGSDHVALVGNMSYDNESVGIHLNGAWEAPNVYKIEKCTLLGNVCVEGTRGIELDHYCEGNTVIGNSVFANGAHGIWELANQGNDHNAFVANTSTQNTASDPYDEFQIVKTGANSIEEHNIKRWQLYS